MFYYTVVVPRLTVDAIAIYPFILIQEASSKKDKILINHELIHFKQQLEMLLIFFYLFYLFQYIFNLLRYNNHKKAYEHIMFECEAYAHEEGLSYLSKRKTWAWVKA